MHHLIAALIFITNGTLWMYWLRRLDTTGTTAVPPSPPQQRCRDVLPTLRSFLEIFAWIGLTVSVGGSVASLMYVYRSLDPQVFVRFAIPTLLVALLYGALFVTQIAYVRDVARSDQCAVERCSEIETVKHAGLAIAAALIIALGLFHLFQGLLHDHVTASSAVPSPSLSHALSQRVSEMQKRRGR